MKPVISLFYRSARPLGIALGGVRTGLGIAALCVPRLAAAPWVGKAESNRPSVKLFARTLGGRDVALGIGALLALTGPSSEQRFTGASGWIAAGALADIGDTAATITHFSDLPHGWRYGILAMAASAAALGIAIVSALDD